MIVPVRCDAEPSHVNMVRSRAAWLGVRCHQPDCAGWVRTFRPVANDLWRSWPAIACCAALALLTGGIGAWLVVRDSGGDAVSQQTAVAPASACAALVGRWEFDPEQTAARHGTDLASEAGAALGQHFGRDPEAGRGVSRLLGVSDAVAALLEDVADRSAEVDLTVDEQGRFSCTVRCLSDASSWNGIVRARGAAFLLEPAGASAGGGFPVEAIADGRLAILLPLPKVGDERLILRRRESF